MKRLVIDPVTRIEGHLRIEAEIKDGVVQKAYSSGTMVRGIEIILRGRDPREAWALAQRICGVCTTVHAIASVRAVEDALQWKIPQNASLIRKLMIGTLFVHDHVVHFYHLHSLDWVNPVEALKADPQTTSQLAKSISSYEKASPAYFAEVQKKLKQQVERKQLGIFSRGYWDHPQYKLPPEVNLLLIAHYLDALNWQTKIVQVHTIFGGKNPHPNFVVGGMPSPINPDSDSAINMEKLNRVASLVKEMQSFVEEVYLPDLLLLAKYYRDWFFIGEGLGNFLVMGEPMWDIHRDNVWFIPPGFVRGRNLKDVEDVDIMEIKESIAHSWYTYTSGDNSSLHPWEGETNLKYTGPKPPYDLLNVDGKYSWLKAPRYKGYSVEVGPLARVLILMARDMYGIGERVKEILGKLDLPEKAMFSTMGRTLARGIETELYASSMETWLKQLVDNIKRGDTKVFEEGRWDPSTWPKEAKGVGIMEAPRGSLSHWIHIKEGKIANYQAVVPTTWNGSPRDEKGQPSAYEAAIVGHTVHNPEEPLEILRTIHSFDPCLACAVHFIEKLAG
ncbi:nickel-dependent hydrogenase large subunit [Thermocrinis albus DSM 14484]|uniref:Nickel-dependent hydrogenase large subunit n=1 Tax=Thermocrinis albus (strain DSM 14484 / JCM 11386 / HI 11/12) TaxID=638303 RepID=D3SMR5_THEAH|nr:nickel-dependent hydrogenase large subunit [Thermocrinis albus]ADC90045.1 nickel-dependent hydrogenase large subunit [Thermocrinis albus DSM 14484]